eukprot:3577830-Amphidinium_carterae.1
MALREFERDFYAASSIKPHLSRVKFVRSTLQKWGEDFPPISVRGVMCLGATLKAGGYRSAKLYLSTARVESQKVLTTPMAAA